MGPYMGYYNAPSRCDDNRKHAIVATDVFFIEKVRFDAFLAKHTAAEFSNYTALRDAFSVRDIATILITHEAVRGFLTKSKYAYCDVGSRGSGFDLYNKLNRSFSHWLDGFRIDEYTNPILSVSENYEVRNTLHQLLHGNSDFVERLKASIAGVEDDESKDGCEIASCDGDPDAFIPEGLKAPLTELDKAALSLPGQVVNFPTTAPYKLVVLADRVFLVYEGSIVKNLSEKSARLNFFRYILAALFGHSVYEDVVSSWIHGAYLELL